MNHTHDPESDLKGQLERAILAQAGVTPEDPADPSSLLRLVDASTQAVDLCGQIQRTSVHQARRAEVSWSDIGSVMGITRQAAQQRFAPETEPAPQSQELRHLRGATAFNEMQMLHYEGLAGWHLVGFGPLFLTLQASTQVWEHQRVLSLSPWKARRALEAEGWIYVGSWFPFHYFKRIVR